MRFMKIKKRKQTAHKKYFFTVMDLRTGERISEFKSILSIPAVYCNEKRYKITYRTEAAYE